MRGFTAVGPIRFAPISRRAQGIFDRYGHRTWVRWAVIVAGILVIAGLWLWLGSPLAVADAPGAPAAQGPDGQAIYEQRCAACHGLEGDGAGPAAVHVDPKPRDFRRGWYKIRTTASGQLPTDEDLVQVIAQGMPGTTMPGWEGILTDAEMQAVATYIKGFSRRFERETPASVAVGPKVEASPESIARGKEIFVGEAAECVKCHGEMGRGDGPSADELTEDAFGDVIVPADLTMAWLFRGGPKVDDIYMRLKTGLTGSPMPSYADVLSDDQLWDLANYVDSLSADAAPELQAAITAFRVEGPITPEAWQNTTEYYYPLVGQIMREPRNYTPSVQGVWVRALYNEDELVLSLRWHDRFQDAGAEGGLADTLAVQFPAQLSEGDERPYFVFGDSATPVNLWVWNAATNTVEEHNGRGVDAVTSQATQNAQGAASFADGEYRLIVRRAMETGDEEDIQFEPGRFIPIVFMAWDGWRGEEGAAGAISAWHTIYLDDSVPIINYATLSVPLANSPSGFEVPLPTINFAFIVAAVIVAIVLEGVVVWGVRQSTAAKNVSAEES